MQGGQGGGMHCISRILLFSLVTLDKKPQTLTK
jgi:hypothetical protein